MTEELTREQEVREDIAENLEIADQILALTDAYYKEKYKDYVKLDKDQSLPKDPYDVEWGIYRDAQKDMLQIRDGKAWRKVILEKK